MLKNIKYCSVTFVIFTTFVHFSYGISCGGRFPNPITDICWKCMFPVRIGPAPITMGETPNFDPPPPLFCACPLPGVPLPRPGVGVSFWEPARVAEVVKTPFCFPTLNGAILGTMPFVNGTNNESDGKSDDAFYHVHWIQYPVLNWLGIALAGGACLVNETFDVAYMSEVDPLWDDDELAFILNPEAVLFANPVAQLACAADSVSAAVANFGLDPLFWCSGSQGSVYPLDGSVADHHSGIDSSLLLVHRMIFKMHRQGLAHDTSVGSLCTTLPSPVMRKNQYKQQMMYPIPNPLLGIGFGKFSSLWGIGREFPYKGEDFSYLVWRKRRCCAF